MRVLLAVALLATSASADPVRPVRVALSATEPAVGDDRLHLSLTVPERTRDHAIYLELGGRAGLWGVGYDWQFRRRFAVGAAMSYYSFDGDRFATLAPYVAAYPIDRGHHRGFVQLGAGLSRRTTPAPDGVAWSGYSADTIAPEISAGYEYRNRVLFRAYAMAAREDHILPWFGASFGWTL
jgi:hypothetical protein